MFKWYQRYLFNKYASKFNSGLVDKYNYMYVTKMITMATKLHTGTMLPKRLIGLEGQFSVTCAIDLLNMITASIHKLRRGEKAIVQYNLSKVTLGNWTTDSRYRPVRLNVYLKELTKSVTDLESLLHDIGSMSQVDLEFHLNVMASALMDVVKLSKLLSRK